MFDERYKSPKWESPEIEDWDDNEDDEFDRVNNIGCRPSWSPCGPNQCMPNQCMPRQCWPRQCWPRQCMPRQCQPRQCWPRQCWPRQCRPRFGYTRPCYPI